MSPAVRALLLSSLLAALVPVVASAQPSESGASDDRMEALRERARRLEEVRGHEAAEDALAHARRALLAARRLGREGRPGARERSLDIAEAALVLADRIAARRRAALALQEAREREEAARRRARVAREALEAALAERARARRARDEGS